MNDQSNSPLDRLQELLADRALFGLDEAEQKELDALLASAGDVDLEALDRTAASAQLALLGDVEALPTGLAEKLAATGRQMVATSTTGTSSVQLAPVARTTSRREWLAWLAAAASIVFALFALDRGPIAPSSTTSPAALRAELLAEPSAVTQVAWTAGGDEAGKAANGNVVWHNGRQQGVMQFKNLAANDPTESQYQLWIFDQQRDERYPIDGGVFNIPAGQKEVLVKINAKLPVTDPTLFAITVEKPGGVVVSSRERLPLLAKVE